MYRDPGALLTVYCPKRVNQAGPGLEPQEWGRSHLRARPLRPKGA